MNSNDIRYWAKRLQIKDFLGTYAVDQLKSIKKSQLGPLIFNTDIASKIGKHWVAIHIDKNVLTVFDPLGYKNLDLTCPFLKSFFIQQKKNICINNIQIQTKTSSNCGIHCLLFCHAISQKAFDSTFQLFLTQFDLPYIWDREKLALEKFSSICLHNTGS